MRRNPDLQDRTSPSPQPEVAPEPPNASAPALRLRLPLPPLPMAGCLLLILTALLLLGPGWSSSGPAASAVLLLHIFLGLLLLLPVGGALRRALRREPAARRRTLLRLLALCGGMAGVTGLLFIGQATQGGSAGRQSFSWWLHLVGGFAAVLFLLLAALPQKSPPEAAPSPARSSPRSLPSAVFLLWLLLAAPGALWKAADAFQYDAASYYRDLTATNAQQAANPRFPAGLRLDAAARGDAKTALSRWQEQPAAYCGRAGCHAQEHGEWLASAHRYAASDPVYAKVRAETAASNSKAAQWCAGCHAPQAVLETVPRAVPQAVPASAAPAPPEDAAGVDCMACHATVGAPTRTGNGRFTLAVPETPPFASHGGGWQRRLHDFLLRVRPGPHSEAFWKPRLHRSAEFCSGCHRQSFNVPQNHYQFVRGADQYGEWLRSPYSGRAALPDSWFPRKPRTCQECHFPRQGGRASHFAPGANAALPALHGDTGQARRIEAFLRADRIALDIFLLKRRLPGMRQEEWIAPLDGPEKAQARPGEEVELDVVVTNQGIGHSFPSGYEDIKDAWIEFTARDSAGRRLLANGALPAPDAPVPADAHAYRSAPLDRNGRAILRHDLTRMVTSAYRRVIPSGGSDIARYRLRVPTRDASGKPLRGTLRLTARLRYRHLRPDFARWALGPNAPRLPVTDMAETSVTLTVSAPARPGTGGRGAARARGDTFAPSDRARGDTFAPSDPGVALRFIRYGMGLLTAPESPELLPARRAFQRAQALAAHLPEASFGLGMRYLMEPALIAARAQFDAVLRLSPDHAAARMQLGFVGIKQGEYDRALRLMLPLTERFPQDGALHYLIGQAYFNLGQYAAAAKAFQRALAADPDDAPAHFNLMKSYQRIPRLPEARREEAIGRYLAEDRLQARLRSVYLRRHPEERPNTLPALPVRALRPDA